MNDDADNDVNDSCELMPSSGIHMGRRIETPLTVSWAPIEQKKLDEQLDWHKPGALINWGDAKVINTTRELEMSEPFIHHMWVGLG